MKSTIIIARDVHGETSECDTATKSIVLYSRDMDFCVSLSMLFQDRYKIVTITDPDMLMTTVKALQPDLLIADAAPTERMRHRFHLMKTGLPTLRIMLFYAAHYGSVGEHDSIRKFVDAAFSKPIDIEEIMRQIREFMTNDP